MNELTILALANGLMGTVIYYWGVRVGRRREREEFRRNPFSKVGK